MLLLLKLIVTFLRLLAKLLKLKYITVKDIMNNNQQF